MSTVSEVYSISFTVRPFSLHFFLPSPLFSCYLMGNPLQSLASVVFPPQLLYVCVRCCVLPLCGVPYIVYFPKRRLHAPHRTAHTAHTIDNDVRPISECVVFHEYRSFPFLYPTHPFLSSLNSDPYSPLIYHFV